MTNNFEVFTMTDKQKRDELFEDFRKDGSPQERQAIKFSSNEPVMVQDTSTGNVGQLIDLIVYTQGPSRPAIGSDKEKNKQRRPRFRSTWSVAYPREIA